MLTVPHDDTTPRRRTTSESFNIENSPLPAHRTVSFLAAPQGPNIPRSFTSDAGLVECFVTAKEKTGWGVHFAAVANCTNTILGAGTLAVPCAMSLAGVAIYEAMLVAIFSVTFISLRWLVAVTDLIPEDMPCNYEGVSGHFLPAPMTVAIIGAFMVAMFALSMSYMLFIATSLAPLLKVAPLLKDLNLGTDESRQNLVMLVVGCGIILPLSLLRDISKLKGSSVFGTVTLLYSACYVIFTSIGHVHVQGAAESFEYVNLSSSTVVCAAMTFSSFSCHISAMPIYRSLGPARQPRAMMSVLVTSLCLAAVLYQVLGISAYMRFGVNVKGNVLESLAETEPFSFLLALATIGVPANLTCSMPLVMWPLRSCTLRVFRSLAKKDLTSDASATEWWTTTIVLILAVIGAAVRVPDIKTVMGLGSSVGTAFIVFIYPSAFFLAVVKRCKFSEWMQMSNLPQLAMIVFGAFVGAVGFTIGLRNIISNGP